MWLSIVLSTFFPPRSIFVEFKTNNKIIYVRKSWLFEELSLIITLSWESSLRKSCLQIWSGSQKRSTCIIIYFINIYMYMLKVALSCTCMLPEDRQIDDWEWSLYFLKVFFILFYFLRHARTDYFFFVRWQPVNNFLFLFLYFCLRRSTKLRKPGSAIFLWSFLWKFIQFLESSRPPSGPNERSHLWLMTYIYGITCKTLIF